MDPMEILGGLLRGGKGGGGLGGNILNDLLKGSRRSAPSQQQRPQQQRTGPGPSHQPADIEQNARRLEDLLGVARDRHASGPSPQQAPPRNPTPYSRPPSFEQAGTRYQQGRGRREHCEHISHDDEVVVLIRAMINAAKADGRITPDEQQGIIDRISNPTQDTIAFLRSEFGNTLDVREFAWSVPIGMEQQVYTLSLATIDLDTNPEAQYLRDLAHGLRLSPEVCNQIHQQYRAPAIF